MSLLRLICERIKQSHTSGWLEESRGVKHPVSCISFHEYMSLCLYNERFGYYKSGEPRVGRTGDFYTSSGIGTIMGEVMASYIREMSIALEGSPIIAEWGGGTGRLSAQMLQRWTLSDCQWMQQLQYWFIDDNPVHLAAAVETLKQFKERIRIRMMTAGEALDNIGGETPIIVLANELLDAFPVHRIVMKKGRLLELGVTVTGEEERLAYCYMPLSDPLIEVSLKRDGVILAEAQETEVNLEAERWLTDLGTKIKNGCLVLIDYGDTADELRASHRMKGTLLCYRRHQAADDPFQTPGEQDITAHVNYSACRSAAEAAGWSVVYYQTQKQFLVDHGILELLSDYGGSDPFSPEARRNRAIRQLLLSDGMSESFKVMVLRK
ncbi:class I SAM-dependent methyltransferase [Paenibacillus tarimensis]